MAANDSINSESSSLTEIEQSPPLSDIDKKFMGVINSSGVHPYSSPSFHHPLKHTLFEYLSYLGKHIKLLPNFITFTLFGHPQNYCLPTTCLKSEHVCLCTWPGHELGVEVPLILSWKGYNYHNHQVLTYYEFMVLFSLYIVSNTYITYICINTTLDALFFNTNQPHYKEFIACSLVIEVH